VEMKRFKFRKRSKKFKSLFLNLIMIDDAKMMEREEVHISE
jgi:hypothetical protein